MTNEKLEFKISDIKIKGGFCEKCRKHLKPVSLCHTIRIIWLCNKCINELEN